MSVDTKEKLIAIIGPTASGKTALGVDLAQAFLGEIVSCDAKQVYRGMDIGTAKERDLPVPQHLIDIKEPGSRVTVAEYQRLAYVVIDEILARNKHPFLVGGSMLYAESVLNGYTFSEDRQVPRYSCLKLGITVGREELRRRVATRTESWLAHGLLKEIEDLLSRGVPIEWLRACGQEYRYFTDYLQGELSLEEAIGKTNTSINQYTKRQYTWWRRHPDVVWVDGREEPVRRVTAFLAMDR